MTRLEKWSVLSTSVATAVTGVGYFGIKYLLEPAEPWAVINHPLQPWLLKAHILVAPFLVFSVGMITLRHVWRHFQSRTPWGRRSGILAALALAPMIVSGYLIQAVTHAGWLTVTAWAHIGFGAAYALGAALHWPALRRARAGTHPGTGNAPRRRRAIEQETRERQPA